MRKSQHISFTHLQNHHHLVDGLKLTDLSISETTLTWMLVSS